MFYLASLFVSAILGYGGGWLLGGEHISMIMGTSAVVSCTFFYGLTRLFTS